MEGLKPLFLEQVFAVVRDWSEREGFDLWPADDSEKKKKFVEFCFEHGLLTLLSDSQNRLEGFLFFYRQPNLDGLNMKRPEQSGRFLVCDVLWVRPDLRQGNTLKRLIKKAVIENKEKILGAEVLKIQKGKAGYKNYEFNFPKFFRRFA